MPLSGFLKQIKRFIDDKEGASGIEYAVIATMVAVVLAGFVPGVSASIKTTFTAIAAAL